MFIKARVQSLIFSEKHMNDIFLKLYEKLKDVI